MKKDSTKFITHNSEEKQCSSKKKGINSNCTMKPSAKDPDDKNLLHGAEQSKMNSSISTL